MPPGVELAAAYISLTPTAKNIAREMERQIVGPADKAGKDAGRAIEEGIGGGATRGAQAARAGISLISGAAVISGLNKAKDAASGLQQAVGGTVAVFGEQGDAVEAAAERAAESAGLSERAFREMTSQIGASLKGYGFSVDEAADKSIELTQLGADLAATFGGTSADAVQALGSALRGEFDPLERYGIALRQNAIDAKAVELGLAASTTEVSAQARAQAALAIITEQSADAQGQFARESDSAAGQAQIAAAKTEDAAASLGEAILPIYARIAEVGGTVADVFAALPGPVQAGVVALAGIVAVAGPISNVVGLYQTLTATTVASTAATTVNTGAVVANATATNSAATVKTLYAASTARATLATTALTTALKVGAVALAGYAIGAGVVETSRRRAREAGQDLAAQFRSEFVAAESYEERVRRVNQRIGEYNEVVDDANSGTDIFNNDDAAQLSNELGPLIEQEIQLVGVIEDYGRAGGDANEASRILGDNYERVAQLLEEGYTPAQIVATLETEQASQAQQRNADAAAQLATETAEAQAAIDEITQSMSEFIEQSFASSDATANWEGALDDLTASIEENGATLDLSTEQGRENYQQGREVADGLVQLMQRRFEETGSVQAAIDAGNLYVEQLKNQLRQSGLTEAQVQTYIDTLNLTPTNIATNFQANTAEAVRQIQELQRIAAGVAANSYEIDYSVRAPGPRAAGGPVLPGSIYTVGEQGPELAVFGAAGRILSREDSMAAVAMAARPSGIGAEVAFTVGMAAGASPIGEGRQVVQNFYGRTDPTQVGREVRRVHMTMRS